MNWDFSDVQARFRKGRRTRDQIANIHWITEKAREFQKNIYLCFIDYAKVFDCVDHSKLWKILKEMGIWDHFICFLRNLYAGQEVSKNSSVQFSSVQFSSVQFSRSIMSHSLRPHELQHTRPLCPSPTSGVHSNSCPLSRWCHPGVSSSVVPSSCPQSLPASESFPMSQLFPWGGQSIGVSALASVPPKKFQGWSPSEWTGWISLQSKGLSRVFSNITV